MLKSYGIAVTEIAIRILHRLRGESGQICWCEDLATVAPPKFLLSGAGQITIVAIGCSSLLGLASRPGQQQVGLILRQVETA
jgi:hypothetical protein